MTATKPSSAMLILDVQIIEVTGTTYTIPGSANGKLIFFNNASAVTVTVPETLTEAIDAGFQCGLIQEGAGQVSLVAEGSDIINSKDSKLNLTGQHSGATIHKRTAGSPNTWYLIGDLA
ncbi:MAG: hypothetical protein GY832_45100 [Chloroflexi bacterium]|nr:hypothetical protein [Chloroflexota bacterium]